MSNKQIVEQFYAALTAANVNKNFAQARLLLTPDLVWCAAHPINDLQGRDEFFTNYWSPITTALPDVERKPFVVVEGDFISEEEGEPGRWVNSIGYLVGTFDQPLFDIPATGKTLFLRYFDLVRIADGKIAECYVILDFVDAMQQADVNPLRASLGHNGLIAPPTTMDGTNQDDVNGEEGARTMKLVEDMLNELRCFDGKSLSSMHLEKYWHPDFMWYGPGGIGTTRGIEGFRKQHQGPFLNAFPDRDVVFVKNFIGERNYAAIGGWPHMTVTHSGGGWLGVPPTGKALTIRVMDLWRREGNLFMENWVSIDIIELLLQMGLDVFAQMRELYHKN
ncbi:MAG: ester cyclase [Pseudomonadales bacterium]